MCYNDKKSAKSVVTTKENIIIKTFFDEQDFATEYYFYKEFRGFPFIPKLLKTDKRSLYFEYIKGKSLFEVDVEEQLFLAKTLGSFHNLSLSSIRDETETTYYSLIHHDTNLNNYLYSDGKVYIFDFSDISIDHPLCDVYSALLFFCEIHLPEVFSSFFNRFCDIYFGILKCSLNHSAKVLYKEINRFEERREKHGKCIKNYHYYMKNKDVMVTRNQ